MESYPFIKLDFQLLFELHEEMVFYFLSWDYPKSMAKAAHGLGLPNLQSEKNLRKYLEVSHLPLMIIFVRPTLPSNF